MRIIIVDDEPKVRGNLREMVVRWDGCDDVAEAGDGVEALEIIPVFQPDLVITDIRMPRMDGLQLLKEVRRQGYRVGQIILSGYSDFAYTQRAIQQGVHNYLLKPVEEHQLLEALSQAQQDLEHDRQLRQQLQQGELAWRERTLVRLIHGRGPVRPLPDVFSFEGKSARLYMLDVRADECPDYSDVVEYLQDEGRVFASLDESRWVCLSFTGLTPHSEAQYLRDCFSTDGTRVTVAYGEMLSSSQQLEASYQQLSHMLESRWLLPNSDVLSATQLQLPTDENAWSCLKQWSHAALDEAIDREDIAEIKRQTTRLFQILKGYRSVERDMRALFIEAVIHTMRRVLDQGGDADMVLGERLNINEMLTQRSVEELQRWYTELCLRVARYLAEMHTKRPRCVSEQVMAMFKEDPSQTWSLAGLAATFYMSPAYLGQVFKKETGQSVHAHLTSERIRLAKEALENSDAPVYEIAERYGYSNLRSFYTAFKKSENCTPSEYRERMRNT